MLPVAVHTHYITPGSGLHDIDEPRNQLEPAVLQSLMPVAEELGEGPVVDPVLGKEPDRVDVGLRFPGRKEPLQLVLVLVLLFFGFWFGIWGVFFGRGVAPAAAASRVWWGSEDAG